MQNIMLEFPANDLPDVDQIKDASFNYYDSIKRDRDFNMKDIENFIVPNQKKILTNSLEVINAKKLFPKTIIQFIHMLKTASLIKGDIIKLHVCNEGYVICVTTRGLYYVKYGTSSNHFHPVVTIYGKDNVNVSPSTIAPIDVQATYVCLKGRATGEFYLIIIDSKKEFINGEITYQTYATYTHRNEFCKKDSANIHKFRNGVHIADVCYESGAIINNNSARVSIENLVLIYDFKLANDLYNSFRNRVERKDLAIKYVKSIIVTLYGKNNMIYSAVQYVRGVLSNVSFITDKGQWFISRNMWIFQDASIRIKFEKSGIDEEPLITVMNSSTFKDDENLEFNVSNCEFSPSFNYWEVLEVIKLVKKEYIPKYFPDEIRKDV